MTREPVRCTWAGTDPAMVAYHDDEWGVPQHDDQRLFEKISLEGAQAGLSWSTILRKREGYRRAFSGFDPAKVARFTPAKVERLLADPGDRAQPGEDRVDDRQRPRGARSNASSAASTRTSGRSSTARRSSTVTGIRRRSTRRPRSHWR